MTKTAGSRLRGRQEVGSARVKAEVTIRCPSGVPGRLYKSRIRKRPSKYRAVFHSTDLTVLPSYIKRGLWVSWAQSAVFVTVPFSPKIIMGQVPDIKLLIATKAAIPKATPLA